MFPARDIQQLIEQGMPCDYMNPPSFMIEDFRLCVAGMLDVLF